MNTLLQKRAVVVTALLLTITLPAPAQDDPPPAVEEPAQTNVYRSQFDKQVEFDRWDPMKAGKAPNGKRFLGEYSKMARLDFTLNDLPEHRYVRVRFDLLVLKSWDGSHVDGGHDTWGIREVGGPLLLLTSFSTKQVHRDAQRALAEKWTSPQWQGYPDEYPLLANGSGTGSTGKDPELGFKGQTVDSIDAVYKIDLIFPHSEKELKLQFFSHLNNGRADESWALDNVIVDTVEGDLPLDEKQLDELWAQISGKDSVAANQALWKMVAAGQKGFDAVEKRWKKFAEGNAAKAGEIAELLALQQQIAKILPGLTDESFVNRQLAQTELRNLGGKALGPLESEMKTTKDPELRRALAVTVKSLSKKVATTNEVDPKLLVRSRVEHIRRIFETRTNGYKITGSAVKKSAFGYDNLGAAADGFFPALSLSLAVPRYTWFPQLGSEEWLQYDFPKAKTISAAGVFWFVKGDRPGGFVLPKSWQIQYLDGAGDWKPVEHRGNYPLELDKMNRVTFKPVRTTAVRLIAKLKKDRSAGVHEFFVSEEKKPAAK